MKHHDNGGEIGAFWHFPELATMHSFFYLIGCASAVTSFLTVVLIGKTKSSKELIIRLEHEANYRERLWGK